MLAGVKVRSKLVNGIFYGVENFELEIFEKISASICIMQSYLFPANSYSMAAAIVSVTVTGPSRCGCHCHPGVTRLTLASSSQLAGVWHLIVPSHPSHVQSQFWFKQNKINYVLRFFTLPTDLSLQDLRILMVTLYKKHKFIRIHYCINGILLERLFIFCVLFDKKYNTTSKKIVLCLFW